MSGRGFGHEGSREGINPRLTLYLNLCVKCRSVEDQEEGRSTKLETFLISTKPACWHTTLPDEIVI